MGDLYGQRPMGDGPMGPSLLKSATWTDSGPWGQQTQSLPRAEMAQTLSGGLKWPRHYQETLSGDTVRRV